MIAICIESSHQKGMGHLFRCMNLLAHAQSEDESCLVLINDHGPSVDQLKEKGTPYEIVKLRDTASDWESTLIQQYSVDLWINDRLDTDFRHASNVKKNGIPLVTFDDRGTGAELCDLHFAPLLFDDADRINGRRVLAGTDYLVLDPEIERHKRLRTSKEKIIVTLGGSDTYGTTMVVLRLLKQISIEAAIHIGPSFESRNELEDQIDESYPLISSVSCLVEELSNYDLAITGGGITPFEANAAGLPCLTISNEDHELPACRYLHSIGTSFYLGHRDEITAEILDDAIVEIDIEKMSASGMEKISTNGAGNIWAAIREMNGG